VASQFGVLVVSKTRQGNGRSERDPLQTMLLGSTLLGPEVLTNKACMTGEATALYGGFAKSNRSEE
jgi:hypothetical protein